MNWAEFEAQYGVMLIPIRADKSVRIHGIPQDLSADEADKIARVIESLACAPDGSPKGLDAKQLDGEAATAGNGAQTLSG